LRIPWYAFFVSKKKSTQTFRAGMMKMILIVVLVTIGIRHWFWSSPPSQSVWKNESLETKTMKAHNDPITNTNTNTIISQETKEKHRAWAKKLPKHAKLKAYNLDGPPGQIHWDWHPTKRLDRFPSVEERVSIFFDCLNLHLSFVYTCTYAGCSRPVRTTPLLLSSVLFIVISLFDLDTVKDPILHGKMV
jgi:hypothetical protein